MFPSNWISVKILGGTQLSLSISASVLGASTRLMFPGSPPPVICAIDLMGCCSSIFRIVGVYITDGRRSSWATVTSALSHAGSFSDFFAISKNTFRAREYPLLRSPGECNPMIVSPGRTLSPVIMSSLSTTPALKPTSSNSPDSIKPGCSAISPPIRAHPASLHPVLIPLTIDSIWSGINVPTEM